MRKLPIGNDQPIRWAVTVSGKPFNLEGQDVHVYVVNSRGEIPLRSLKVKGAEVSGVFEGRYQTRLGEHSLILRVNEGHPEMKTASVANVFEIVKWSADAGGSDEGDVIITPVILESELSIGGVSYDDTELREAIEDLEQKKVNKTDLATINGQRIDEGGNIEIEASEGTLTAEEVSSTEPTAAFPQVLYTAQSLSDAQKSQARENIGVSEAIEEAIAEIPAPESSVFEAIYGETTYDEIVEQYNANKHVIVKYGEEFLSLVRITKNNIDFTSIVNNSSIRVTCASNNAWNPYSYTLEWTRDKVKTINAESTALQYPSAKAVYDFVGKQGVIRQTQTWTQAADKGYDYVMSDIVRGAIPQANIDLFTSAGAVFNEESGYFELNGLTDISYEEMQAIYNAGYKMVEGYWCNNIRTNIFRPCNVYNTDAAQLYGFVGMYANRNCTAESFKFTEQKIYGVALKGIMYGTYEDCIYLKTFGDGIFFCQDTNISDQAFNRCYSLETIYIRSLKKNIWFKDSARLSEASVLYMVANSAATSAIVITLHADAYARAMADAEIVAALEAHPNVSLASA